MSESAGVLIVEDDESIRQFLEMALRDDGYSVASATDGASALDAISRFVPSVILLDLRMPGIDGWSFARAYRKLPGPHAPIVVLTAARDAAEHALQIEADGFLAKPFDLWELLQIVRRFARRG